MRKDLVTNIFCAYYVYSFSTDSKDERDNKFKYVK